MKKIIIGFIIGSLMFGGAGFAKEVLTDFEEQSVPTLNDIIRRMWFAIDDLNPRKFAKTTISDGDTTPDVSGGNVFITSSNTGATEITTFDNARAGQVIILIGGSNNNASTLADGGAVFFLTAGFTASLNDSLTLYYNGSIFIELARGNN